MKISWLTLSIVIVFSFISNMAIDFFIGKGFISQIKVLAALGLFSLFNMAKDYFILNRDLKKFEKKDRYFKECFKEYYELCDKYDQMDLQLKDHLNQHDNMPEPCTKECCEKACPEFFRLHDERMKAFEVANQKWEEYKRLNP
jgi:hypothetical protein